MPPSTDYPAHDEREPGSAAVQPGENPAEPKRRTDRAATTGVIGALAGTLLGAVIAGVFSLAQARAQISGTTRENLRTERQESYSALLTDYLRLQAAAVDYVNAVLYSDATGSSGLAGTYNVARLKVEQDISTVEIVGSLSVMTYAETFRLPLLKLDHSLVKVTVVTKISPDEQAKDELRAALEDVENEQRLGRFRDAARADVGAS